MIMDKFSTFSEALAITATVASDVIDLGALGKTAYGKAQLKRDMRHSHVPLRVQVVETFNNLTSLKIAVESDDNSGFASPKELVSETVLLADLKAGFVSVLDKLPRSLNERYVRIKFTVVGTAPSLGKVTAFIPVANSAGIGEG
jgi:hypothetical protein